MTLQTAPEVGDLITFGKSKTIHMVTHSAMRLDDSCGYDGTPWRVHEFSTLKHFLFEPAGSAKDPVLAHWYLDGGSMSGTGKLVHLSDITLVGRCRVRETHSTTYTWDRSTVTKVTT